MSDIFFLSPSSNVGKMLETVIFEALFLTESIIFLYCLFISSSLSAPLFPVTSLLPDYISGYPYRLKPVNPRSLYGKPRGSNVFKYTGRQVTSTSAATAAHSGKGNSWDMRQLVYN